MTIEEPLAGFVSTVVRVGDEVRRETRPTSPAVHLLLEHLERAGFDGAPRFLGIDEQGRERLSYTPGETYPAATPETVPDRVLPAVGRLVRSYHEAVAGFVLPPGLSWFAEAEPDVPGEHLVCHNDIAPRNMVFHAGEPRIMIDWDLAYPAPAVWDVTHMVWQFVPILADAHFRSQGWPHVPAIDARMRRVRLLVDAYGLDAAQRAVFADVLALRIGRTASGIRAEATAGKPVFQKLVDDGVVNQIERDQAWAAAHRDVIAAAIS
jgi:hypothetical protein